jgi:hypothetical protein
LPNASRELRAADSEEAFDDVEIVGAVRGFRLTVDVLM